MSAAVAEAPVDVFCVLENACRDLAVADAVVAGRFPVAGQTLALGLTPDWGVDPYPADKEWRIEWTKFYFGLDLAHASAATGEPRYRETWARLVTSYVARVPPAADEVEVMARRIQNWIYAWNRFAREGANPVALGEAGPVVAAYLWREVQHVRAHLTQERNHRTLELYALLIAALAFPSFDPGHELRDFAWAQLHENLLDDIWTDGVHRECSTHYHCIVLRSFLGAMQNARLAGLAVPASYVERVTLACEFALHCHRPDGVIPACADADSESYGDVLALAGRLLDRPDFRWSATMGRDGQPPTRRHASFARGGYHMQRSGWGASGAFADERFLIFDCGPLGDGGHGHYDALSLEAAAYGRPLVIDPGRFTYAEATPVNWRHWFKGTAAHNTVGVDGLDQTPYARRRPKGPVATTRLLARATAPSLDVLVGDTTSPAYEAVHQRAVIFVAGEYWLVVDTLRGELAHRYELRWHLAAGASDGPPRVHGGVVTARDCILAIAPGHPLHLEDGWHAPLYGVKHPAPVIVATAAGATATFATAIVPTGGRRAGAPQPSVRLVPHGAGSAVVVADVTGIGKDGNSVDTLSWSVAPHAVALGGFRGVARAAWMRLDDCGQRAAFAAADVSHGTWTHDGLDTDVPSGDGDGGGRWLTWTAGDAAPVAGRGEA